MPGTRSRLLPEDLRTLTGQMRFPAFSRVDRGGGDCRYLAGVVRGCILVFLARRFNIEYQRDLLLYMSVLYGSNRVEKP